MENKLNDKVNTELERVTKIKDEIATIENDLKTEIQSLDVKLDEEIKKIEKLKENIILSYKNQKDELIKSANEKISLLTKEFEKENKEENKEVVEEKNFVLPQNELYLLTLEKYCKKLKCYIDKEREKELKNYGIMNVPVNILMKDTKISDILVLFRFLKDKNNDYKLALIGSRYYEQTSEKYYGYGPIYDADYENLFYDGYSDDYAFYIK